MSKDIKAFPSEHEYMDGLEVNKGMNLRDYFAAHIAMGVLADNNNVVDDDKFAREVYKVADAMIKARQ